MAPGARWLWMESEATHDAVVRSEAGYVSRLESERKHRRDRLMNRDIRHGDVRDV